MDQGFTSSKKHRKLKATRETTIGWCLCNLMRTSKFCVDQIRLQFYAFKAYTPTTQVSKTINYSPQKNKHSSFRHINFLPSIKAFRILCINEQCITIFSDVVERKLFLKHPIILKATTDHSKGLSRQATTSHGHTSSNSLVITLPYWSCYGEVAEDVTIYHGNTSEQSSVLWFQVIA